MRDLLPSPNEFLPLAILLCRTFRFAQTAESTALSSTLQSPGTEPLKVSSFATPLKIGNHFADFRANPSVLGRLFARAQLGIDVEIKPRIERNLTDGRRKDL